jgi:hypothetical protein
MMALNHLAACYHVAMATTEPLSLPGKPTNWLALGERVLLAAFAMLLTAGTLIATDTPPGLGMFVAQSAMWMAFGAGVSVWFVCRRQDFRWDHVELLAIGCLCWTFASILAVRGTGNLRSAINAFFQLAAWTVAILATRHLLNTSQRRQTMLTLALSLASAIAILAILQFFVFDPQRRAEIETDPLPLLTRLGIDDRDSPAAQREIERALNKGPLGTFALTSSLGSYLVPWIFLIAAAIWQGIGSNGKRGKPVRWLCIAAALLLLIAFAGSLLLTHSEMLSTPPSDRWQHWRSTLAMIADHWLLGCGPGNFGSVYTFYKLPEANGEIGDPHNFLLETWAATGTPGMLLFLALVGVSLWRIRKNRVAAETAEAKKPFENVIGSDRAAILTIGIGAAAAFPLAHFSGTPQLGVVATALAICFLVLRPLVTDRLLQSAAIPIAVVALLVNLLASGGISFPNVALSLAFLLGLASRRGSLDEPTSISSPALNRRAPLVALGISSALFLSCYWFCYWPVMLSQSAEPEDVPSADPYDPQLCRSLAKVELERLALGKRDALGLMEDALDKAVRRDPRSYSIHQEAGNARLYAFRLRQRRDLLLRAIDDYAAAVEHYPNDSFVHAQLAWAYHVAGNAPAARKEAQEALRLDALCRDKDKLLEHQRLSDPGMSVLEQASHADSLMKRLAKPPTSSSS